MNTYLGNYTELRSRIWRQELQQLESTLTAPKYRGGNLKLRESLSLTFKNFSKESEKTSYRHI